MKLLCYCLVFCIFLAFSKASLLEMSRTLWAQLLNGGIAKIGKLDPLTVPIIKVDQSEGNLTYRMILKDIKITGLNNSVLESVQVARGKLKSNFSDVEAGFVTYTDLKDLDTIRYRFRTLKKNEKDEKNTGDTEFFDQRFRDNEKTRSKPGNDRDDFGGSKGFGRTSGDSYRNNRNRFNYDEKTRSGAPGVELLYSQKISASESRDQDNSKDQVDCFGSCTQFEGSSKNRPQQSYDQQRFRQQEENEQQQKTYQQQGNQQRGQGEQQRYFQQQRQFSQDQRYPQDQQYNQQRQYSGQQSYNANYRSSARLPTNDGFEQQGEYRSQINEQSRFRDQDRQRDGYRNQEREGQNYRVDPFGEARRDGSGPATDCPPGTVRSYYQPKGPFGVQNQREYQNRPPSTFNGRQSESQFSSENSQKYTSGSASAQEELFPSRVRDRQGGMTVKFVSNSEQQRASEPSPSSRFTQAQQQQNQKQKPGYIDVIYVDEKNPEEPKHFGNLKLEPGKEVKVFGVQNLMKDLRESGRYIVHNFTEGEALAKRNDLARIAEETKRIKDLIRYAKGHQESEGYFEESMELIYHYGKDKKDNSSDETLRRKRAHDGGKEEKDEEDVMHVVLRVRVPFLQVVANYALTGKVADDFVRGNGRLVANYTELIGDFTVELKKVGENRMFVRSARAKLTAKTYNADLEGMKKNSPLEAIFNEGSTAVEAIAAMIADDLATKSLSEKTADAAVLRMYNDLSADNS